MSNEMDAWPGGETWVFQGTVAEDATAGTHICTLTVTPGVGNEMQVLYGSIVEGNTATAQTSNVFIDDGTNLIAPILASAADTSASITKAFPSSLGAALAANASNTATPSSACIVSGTQRLVLRVITAAVSVTQTFAVACRIKGGVPTATLLDTIGTSTNTINTSKVF